MTDLRVGVFRDPGLGGWVDLCLESCFDDVEGAGDDSGEAASAGTGEHFERHADVAALLVLAGPCGELLPEHELERREGEVSVKSGLVAIEEGRGTLGPDNGSRSVYSSTIIIPRMEVRVVVSTLKL